ncbi:MAG: 50S ribosomal protein L23 [Patescibacteria group bacterium]
MRLFNFIKKKKEEDARKPVSGTPAVLHTPESEKSVKAAETSTQPRRVEDSKKLMLGILLRPLVTEKGTHLEAHGTYQFAVALRATKIDIARAVFARYGTKPVKVNVMHRAGKQVRFGRLQGKRSDWKRALVTLPKGKTINVHEGV